MCGPLRARRPGCLQITYWQRSLLLTGDVVTLLGETQRLWSYLEPLFLLSDEVKRELPRDAEVFATVDVRIRQLTAEFVRMSRVLQCATQDGVLVGLCPSSPRPRVPAVPRGIAPPRSPVARPRVPAVPRGIAPPRPPVADPPPLFFPC